MERSEIRTLIDSGRATALDCNAIGRTISNDDPIGPLFRTAILNKAVILKRYEAAQPAPTASRIFSSSVMKTHGDLQKPVKVSTVVYFPYDLDNVYDGGESLVFSGKPFLKLLGDKISNGSPSQELIDNLGRDGRVLGLLNSMHSLDPFMFRSKAEQCGAEKAIHDAYFAITEEEWQEIQFPIHEKILKLVTKALDSIGTPVGSLGVEDHAARQDYVERFLEKIWQARDIEGIEPFVEAMQIEPKKAPEIFFAWKAICYYQVRFAALLDALKTMFQWVGNDQLFFPTDPGNLPKQQRTDIVEERAMLRKKMRDDYAATQNVLNTYENSYNQFIDDSEPQAFIKFLAKADSSYLLLAAHVSVATHSVNLWQSYMARFGPRLLHEQFVELFDGLKGIYGVEKI